MAQDIKLCFELITHCLAACQNNIQFPSIVIFRFSVRTFQLCRNNLTTPVLVWVPREQSTYEVHVEYIRVHVLLCNEEYMHSTSTNTIQYTVLDRRV